LSPLSHQLLYGWHNLLNCSFFVKRTAKVGKHFDSTNILWKIFVFI